jgi:transposase
MITSIALYDMNRACADWSILKKDMYNNKVFCKKVIDDASTSVEDKRLAWNVLSHLEALKYFVKDRV